MADKVIIFTNYSNHGWQILKALQARDIIIDAIILENKKPAKSSSLIKTLQKKYRYYRKRMSIFDTLHYLLDAIIKRITKTPSPAPSNRVTIADYQSVTSNIHYVNSFNGQDCQSLLEDLQPDILILGGARIIRSHILAIPKKVTLNVHPGLLPEYRGVDVIAWAIFHDDPVGVTVHRVDAGVDTGDILIKREIDIKPFNDITTIKTHAETIAAEAMAEAVDGFINNAPPQPISQTQEQGTQFYRIPLRHLSRVNRKLKSTI